MICTSFLKTTGGCRGHNVLPEFSQYLEEYVYEKIWSNPSCSVSMADFSYVIACA